VQHTMSMVKAMFSEEALADVHLLEHKVSRWAADEFSLGSYSYLPTGATPQDRDELARHEGSIFFAGEATERRYPQTVHGAYMSGLRVAKEVTGHLGLTTSGGKRRAGRRSQQKK